MEGQDAAVIELPVTGWFRDYRNQGYEVTVEKGRATIRVDTSALGSRVGFRLPPPDRASRARDPVVRLARALTAGSRSRYEAVSRILGWIPANIDYVVDRRLSQEPARVLDRRSAYCTGLARLTVALLRAVEVPAREVSGYVVGGAPGAGQGYHRWIEVFYDDRGWVFSDPLTTHHYVPATYVPLASDRLLPGAAEEGGALISRRDRRRIVDRSPWAPPGVTVRRNRARQRAGTLQMEIPGGGAARAVLTGGGVSRSQVLRNGRGVFVGLEPGEYRLEVTLSDSRRLLRRVVFRDRVVGRLEIAANG